MEENKIINVEDDQVDIQISVENDDVYAEESIENVYIEHDYQELTDVSEDDIVDIEVDEAFPYNVENDNVIPINHSTLYNLDYPDHPIGAVIGLQEELNKINSTKRIYSLESGVSEFIKWIDDNPSWEDRTGYFVKLVCNKDTGVEEVDICTNKDDVYGISVRRSGFVGNQIDADRSDDPSYSMVGIVGLLRVRTDGTASVGDYVVPSAIGEATKSENDCGYRVVSDGSYPSYQYVTIAVTPQNDKISKIYGTLMSTEGNIGNIYIRLDDLETNIEDTSHKVNIAIQDSSELKDLVNEHEVAIDKIQQTTNDIANSAQQAIDDARNAIEEANNAINDAQAAASEARSAASDLAETVDMVSQLEPLVRFESEEYSGVGGFVAMATEDHMDLGALITTTSEQGDDLASVMMKADKNGAAIQQLVSHIDRYSVGELSLSYGLTQEEAASILVNDYIYVPTSTHDEVMGDTTISFERGYAYIWNTETASWDIGDAISTATTYSDGTNEGDLWYCWQDVVHTDEDGNEIVYWPGTLYRWSGYEWISVATVRDNYQGRIMSSIKQTADKIESDVVALDGRLTTVSQGVDQISSRVSDAEGNISSVDQRVNEINSTVGTISGTMASLQERVEDNEANITMITYGAFHVAHQSFEGVAPEPIDGNRYTVPPRWNETSEEFEFNPEMISNDGQYYFHSEDKTKYTKALDGEYEIYTIGNKALSSFDSRISDNEASISETNTLVTQHSEAITNVTSKATANEAQITSLAQYNTEQDRVMAGIEQKADANGAAIGLIVTDGAVNGSVLVQAINGQTAAQINANSIVFSTGVSNSDGSFYMKLSEDHAEIKNGDFSITNPYYRILLNPNDAIRVQKNTNIVDDVVNIVNPIWTDMFYTESATGNTYAGGWLLSEGSLSSGTDNTYVNFNSSSEQAYTLWAGAENPASAPFSVTKAGVLNATGATISGNITMIGGSISWDNINESGSSAYKMASNAKDAAEEAESTAGAASAAATEASAIAQQIASGTYKGTYLNEKTIMSPIIVGGYFRTVNNDPNSYAEMDEDGFKIYRSSTDRAKMRLVSNSDGTNVSLRLGAGSSASDSNDNGRLVATKFETYAEIFYQHDDTKYGFRFDQNGISILNGTFDIGTQAYAVFG